MLIVALCKRCPRCEQVKPVGEFSPDRWKADGYASKCRSCDAALSRAYYAANRERVLARMRAYNGRRRAEPDPVAGDVSP